MNGYELHRQWFDFAFEKKEAKVQHTALYLWIVELNNRLGWKKQFGLPTSDTMEGMSIGNKRTYLDTLRDLQKWGFISIVQEAKNQWQSCIIELCCVKSDTAQATALDTALQRQTKVPGQNRTGIATGIATSTGTGIATSTVPIDKQRNKETIKPINHETNNVGENADDDFEAIEAEEVIEPTQSEKEKAPSKKVAPKKDSPPLTVLPEGFPHGPGFRLAWFEWIAYRKEKKATLTKTTIEKQIKILSGLTEAHAIEVIEKSITNGWQGLFPEKTNKANGSTGTNYQQSTGADLASSALQYAAKVRAEMREPA